jgi:hypothetical protein
VLAFKPRHYRDLPARPIGVHNAVHSELNAAAIAAAILQGKQP